MLIQAATSWPPAELRIKMAHCASGHNDVNTL